VRDVFRAMTTGLDGTPMPSYADSMTAEERWAISYHVLALSAFTDPLTGQPLALEPAVRARLNAADAADGASSRQALDPGRPGAGRTKAMVRFYRGLLGEGR
jgi:cytochrome c oxidase cbb3-type subunit 2